MKQRPQVSHLRAFLFKSFDLDGRIQVLCSGLASFDLHQFVCRATEAQCQKTRVPPHYAGEPREYNIPHVLDERGYINETPFAWGLAQSWR